jgi:1-deoxy-D-xylulose-5-phosphate reductoisomerase
MRMSSPSSADSPAKAPIAPSPGGERTPVRIALLGSTGSIGRQALDVIEALGEPYRVVALAAGSDSAILSAQVARWHPGLVSLADERALRDLALPAGTRAVGGTDALATLAADEAVDLVVVATAGVVSLPAVLAALGAGKVVATANKETLVAGGHLVMPLARDLAARQDREAGDPFATPLAWLRPIDSEHSAIWQCLVGEDLAAVRRLILTASGGPFLDTPPERLAQATPHDALAHPTWRMGAKITIDSATLMNKALEVIEAHWLYAIDYDRIAIVVHPQSVVHSAVEFVDGSLKAQLGTPDMRIPIQYSLTYPRRRPSPAPALDLRTLPELTFRAPDEARFPALRVAREAAARGPRATATLIAADEVAVRRFLAGEIAFGAIVPLIEAAIAHFAGEGATEPDLAELVSLDRETREWSAGAAVTTA